MSEPALQPDLRRTLDRVKGELRAITLATSAVSLVAVSLAALLGVIAADHLFDHGLPLDVRRGLLVLWGVGAAAWIAVFVVRPLVRTISDVYAAWLIEKRHPQLLNVLTTAVELADDPGLPAGIRAGLLRRAEAQTAGLAVAGLADTRPLRRRLLALPLVLAAFVLYALLAPRSIWPSLARALGDAETPAPPRTWLVSVSPGESEEFAGSYPDLKLAPFDPKRPDGPWSSTVSPARIRGDVIEFVADVAGSRPASVRLHWGSRKGDYPAENRADLALHGDVLEGGRLVGRWTGKFHAPAGPVYYRLVAGDATTEDRRLNVLPVPLVSSVTAQVRSPAYVNRPVRRHDFSREDLHERRGSTVELHVVTNCFARGVNLVFEDGREEPLRSNNAAGTEWAGGFIVERTTAFRIEFRNRKLQTNRDAARQYRVEVRPDVPPLVELLSPVGDVAVAIDGLLALQASAVDDIGLSRVSLVYRRSNGTVEAFKLFVQPRAVGETVRKWTGPAAGIAVTDLRVRAGDVLVCRVEAFDNAEPEPQVGESREFKLTITAGGASGTSDAEGAAAGTNRTDNKGAGGGGKSDKGSGNGANKSDKDGAGKSGRGDGDGKSEPKDSPEDGRSKASGGDAKDKKGKDEKDSGAERSKGSAEDEKKDPSDRGRDGSRSAKESNAEGKKGGASGNREPDPRAGTRDGNDGRGTKSGETPDGAGKSRPGDADTPDGGDAKDADELSKALALARHPSTKGSDDAGGVLNEKLEGKTNRIGAFEREKLKKEGGSRIGDQGGKSSTPGKGDKPQGKTKPGDGAAEKGGDGSTDKDDSAEAGKLGGPGAGNSASNKDPVEGKSKGGGSAGDEGTGSDKTPTKRADSRVKASDVDKGRESKEPPRGAAGAGPKGETGGRGADPKAGPESDRLKSERPGEAVSPEVDPKALRKSAGEADELRTVGAVVKTLQEALERKRLDPKLLRDLQWNERDVQNFVRKYQGRATEDRVIPDSVKLRAQNIGRAKSEPARIEFGSDARLGGGSTAIRRDADAVRRSTQQRLEQFDKKFQDFLNDFYNSID